MSLLNIKIYIVDKQKDVVECYIKHFADIQNVEIIRGDIEVIKNVDCVVIGNNSYGLMNSGIDRKLNITLNNIQSTIQSIIDTNYYGEIPVGNCIILKTGVPNYKYLAYCPNMRTQKDVSMTENPYISFRTLLVAILNHNKTNTDKIRSVLCSGFCTGAGKMNPDKSGKLMRLAYSFVNIQFKCSVNNVAIINKLID